MAETKNCMGIAAITLVWLLSDAVSVIGSTIWDLDDSVVARGSIGACSWSG